MADFQLLLCDDEQDIIDILKLYFDSEPFKIFEANNGKEAWNVIQQNKIDLAIIDLMMPEMNGYKLIELIKESEDLPCLILSAKSQLDDKLWGYEVGADDFITKPFEPLEVLAKVKSRLKSCQAGRYQITQDSVTLDRHKAVVSSELGTFDLTQVELEILRMLMESPMRIFTKAQLYERAWKQAYLEDDSSLRVIMSRLREKVGREHIETVRGLGYRWKR